MVFLCWSCPICAVRYIPPQLKWKVKYNVSRMKSVYLSNTQHPPHNTYTHLSISMEWLWRLVLIPEYIGNTPYVMKKKREREISEDMVVYRQGGCDSSSWKYILEWIALSFSGSPLFFSISVLCLIPGLLKTDSLGNRPSLELCSQGH